MTHEEILNKFKDEFPIIKIDDYRPICRELFTDGKQGITIWLENGDIIEYYPKGSELAEAEQVAWIPSPAVRRR